jgi:hypothetical protein
VRGREEDGLGDGVGGGGRGLRRWARGGAGRGGGRSITEGDQMRQAEYGAEPPPTPQQGHRLVNIMYGYDEQS